MTQADQRTIWSLSIRALHWLTAAMIAVELVVSFGPMSVGTGVFEWLPAHVSFGAAVAALVLVRVVWRCFERAPAIGVPPFVRTLASVLHAAMYALLIAVFFTGWAAYRPSPFVPRARLFGLVPMPDFPPTPWLAAQRYASLHRLLVWIFLALLVIHIAAAVFHGVVLKDGVMSGMLRARRHSGRRQG
jgi:cytochrome b561